MTVANRPTQITKILENLNSQDDDEFYAEAERDITELESKQSDRPASIVKFLKRIKSRYSVDIAVALEAYISDLENKQQTLPQKDKTVSYDPENPPYWSHARAEQRAHRRRVREVKKVLHNYQ